MRIFDMHVIAYITILGFLFAPPVLGWLPGGDKEIRGVDGNSHFSLSPSLSSAHRRSIALPTGKIRGVNLGSLFVFEPWLATQTWKKMGCGASLTEFDCVSKLGQSKANTSFAGHWNTWINQSDIQTIVSYGLNTLRIPVGYWMTESLVSRSEHFPQGGLEYLQRICGWASDAGLFIIIDMHGAPGAQTADSVSTGQYASSAGFYDNSQYDRGIKFLSWLTNLTHTVNEFRNVGMIGIVNEPEQNHTLVQSMINDFYPEAYT
ncbi:putative glucan endo-1,6-beta-glucosidase B, partial [Lachnellula suecica]